MKTFDWLTGAINSFIAALSTAPPENWGDPRVFAVASTTFLLSALLSGRRQKEAISKEEITDSIEEGMKTLEARFNIHKTQNAEFRETVFNELNRLVGIVIDSQGDIARLDTLVGGLSDRITVLEHYFSQVSSPLPPEIPNLLKAIHDLRISGFPCIMWPKPRINAGLPKIIRPFSGRRTELKQIENALLGDAPVIAIIGMPGQGKSSLLGEWWITKKPDASEIGLFWSRPYDSGYTFDLFLDEILLYLTGNPIDRRELPETEQRTSLLCELLRSRPCMIILDGAERWLRLWALNPDAASDNATASERSGFEPALDLFFHDAAGWTNGARLIMTTRALPFSLEQARRKTIGTGTERDKRLKSLSPDESLELLKNLGVKGDEGEMKLAAQSYGCHPYAIHLLGNLLYDLYGGDVSHWREVNPLEGELSGLLDKALERHKEYLPLLNRIACSLVASPVEMLANPGVMAEIDLRKRLSLLSRWQIVEFKGDVAEQHALVRKHIMDKLGEGEREEILGEIARWWEEREVPANPQTLEDIRPLLIATEHALEAKDADFAMDIFYTKHYPESLYPPEDWLMLFGFLEENLRLNGKFIDLLLRETKNGRTELRNDLARSYIGRGNTLSYKGDMEGALRDYNRAIEIYETLVEKEARTELRNDLALSYNNRGNALRSKGDLEGALGDYNRAIEIYETLVEKEARREISPNLEISLFNRSLVYIDQKKYDKAGCDLDHGGNILFNLISTGWRHLLPSFMKTFSLRCSHIKKLGKPEIPAKWANLALQTLLNIFEENEVTPVLSEKIPDFLETINSAKKTLINAGLNETLLQETIHKWSQFKSGL
ncbi:tetratricopeptide repeat protein [Candidatus Sumerlaeota bacterium]|nr:tetratricopeptide repeat protein [Candidatus Sumerlaeota bacterium]